MRFFYSFRPMQVCLTIRLVIHGWASDGGALSLFLLGVAAFLIALLAYRKYLLDLLFCDIRVCQGTVTDVQECGGTNLQTAPWTKQYQVVVEQGEEVSSLILIKEPLQTLYQTDLLIQSIRGNVAQFRCLARSRCIVELIEVASRKEPPSKRRLTKQERKARRA